MRVQQNCDYMRGKNEIKTAELTLELNITVWTVLFLFFYFLFYLNVTLCRETESIL